MINLKETYKFICGELLWMIGLIATNGGYDVRV